MTTFRKKSPKQVVQERFGSREELVQAIVPMIDGDRKTRSRLMGATNSKLLRLYEVASAVQDRFGGRKGLIEDIARLQFPNGKPNAGWREKMEGFTVKHLYDHHRQLATTGSDARG